MGHSHYTAGLCLERKQSAFGRKTEDCAQGGSGVRELSIVGFGACSRVVADALRSRKVMRCDAAYLQAPPQEG